MKKLLIIAVSAALMTSFGVNAQTTPYKNNEQAAEQKEETVILLVKRESLEAQGQFPWESVKIPKSELEQKRTKLLADPDVIAVEENQKSKTPKMPPVTPPKATVSMASSNWEPPTYNDPGFPEQRIFQNNSGIDMRLLEAADRVADARLARIGVVDGGFIESPEFNYAGGYNFIDNERFTPGPNYTHHDLGYPCENIQTGLTYHGTSVAAVAAAVADNYQGIAGVSQGAEIVAANTQDCYGYGYNNDISKAIRWLSGDASIEGIDPIDKPVDVINLSLSGGGSCTSDMQDAIDFAVNNGAIVLFSVGNDGGDYADRGWPACDNVIAVSASTHDGELADFSNTGTNVDITATGDTVRSIGEGSELNYISGTSFSTPLVAGVVASAKAQFNGLTVAQVKEGLKSAGIPLPPEEERTGYGSGILDAMKLYDHLGIARAFIAAVNALSGDREQYQEALLHPSATAFLGNKDLCELAEVDARIMPEADKTQPVTLFRVSKGQALIPSTQNAVKTVEDQERFIVDAITSTEAATYDYGIAQCDIATGADCSQATSIRGIENDSFKVSNKCST